MPAKPIKRISILRELPWIFGVGGGWFLLWWNASAMVLDGKMEGYGWSGYVINAWQYAQHIPQSYDRIRGLLHGATLGFLGEWMDSYADAAILISSVSLFAIIASAGLMARLMAGPWAGALAAMSLPLVDRMAITARWANNYPMLAVTTSLSVAVALACARRPSRSLALATGLVLGLAASVDGRGIVVAPLAAALVGLAALRAGWRSGWSLLPLLFIGTLVKPGVAHWVDAPDNREISFEEKLKIQRPVVDRWINFITDDTVQDHCGQLPQSTLLTTDFIATACAWEILQFNFTVRIKSHLPFGLAATLCALPLFLLPGRRRWRDVGEGGLVLIGFVGPLILLSMFTPMADRYIIQFGLLYAIIVPIGVMRLIGCLTPRGLTQTVQALAACSLWIWLSQVDPTALRGARALGQDDHGRHHKFVAFTQQYIQEGDALMDCSGQYIELAILPQRTHYGDPLHRPKVEYHRCSQWLHNPTQSFTPSQGQSVWLAISSDPRLALIDPQRDGASIVMIDEISQSGSWTRVAALERFQLWRFDGVDTENIE